MRIKTYDCILELYSHEQRAENPNIKAGGNELHHCYVFEVSYYAS